MKKTFILFGLIVFLSLGAAAQAGFKQSEWPIF